MDLILGRSLAKKVCSLFEDQIKKFAEQGIIKRGHLHIVVLKPGLNSSDYNKERGELVLYEHRVEPNSWTHHYDAIALAKARTTLRTGLPTSEVVLRKPHLLTDIGDTRHYGSVIHDGIIVACSGVEPWFDEMVAMWVASTLKAMSIDRMQEFLKPEIDFVREIAIPNDEV